MQPKTENATIDEHGDETEQKIMIPRRIAPATSAGIETQTSSLEAVDSDIIEGSKCEQMVDRWEEWVERNRVWIFLTLTITLVIIM